MELLLEEIAGRCLRNALRAAERLAHPRDERELAAAHADLVFAGAIARATVIHLDHRLKCGQVADMAAARIGLVLGQTLRIVADHPNRVMDGSRTATYNRPIGVGFLRETEHLSSCVVVSTESRFPLPLGRPVGGRTS